MTKEELRLWRRMRDFTQEEMADGCDVSRGYYSSIEQGTRLIKPWFQDYAERFIAFYDKCEQERRI